MKTIQKYFKNLNQKQIEQLNQFSELIKEWNSKINLISRKDIEELEERHILHSLAITKVINFKSGTKILDVGTGGGFPGIPLAIFFPEVQFHLIDSIGKKIKVVNEISRELSLTNITAQQIKSTQFKGKFDFVTSRAVTNFPDFVIQVQHLISTKDKNALPNGILYLKGGDFQEEISGFRNRISIYEISDYFEELFFETKKMIYLSA